MMLNKKGNKLERKSSTQQSQEKLIVEFFKKNPNREIKHPEVVDWAVSEYKNRTGKVFRDPDRAVRKLAQSGFLIKIAKGIYKYDPVKVNWRELQDFSAAQKKKILKRDGYRCVICGRGKNDGVELHVDHINPKDKGGEAALVNGQTLCSPCNFRKKNLNQTETGKKMFIRLYELAKDKGNDHFRRFSVEILKVYEKFHINCHIDWKE